VARCLDLTDEQWRVLDPLIPVTPRRADGKGRPPTDRRALLNGVLWVLRTGAAWADLPDRYPPHTTCHRWFQDWVRSGVLEGVLRALAADLRARGGWDLRECFVDGTFVPAKKGGLRWARPSAARGASSWQWRTATVFLSPYARQVLSRTK
jgi:transposase